MVTSWLDREVVWLQVEGEFLAEEIINETNHWLQNHFNDYVGYIVDVRKVTIESTIENRKLEAAARKNNSGKVRAVLGRSEAFSVVVQLYIRLTGAQGMRYFTDEEEARRWIMSFKNPATTPPDRSRRDF